MSRAALSVYMYGLFYVSMIALPFLVFPQFALGVFGLSAADDMWVRYVGVLAGIIGGFYIAGVLSRTAQLYVWTVPARYASGLFLSLMVMMDEAGLALLIIAALDVVTASITWVAIRADAAEAEEAAAV